MRRFAFCLVLLSVGCAHTVISPGDEVQLGEDEGMAVLVIDTDSPIQMFSFQEKDGVNTIIPKPMMEEGKHVQLVKGTVGNYCVDRLRFSNIQYNARGLHMCFKIEAGTITYPGHVHVRVNAEGRDYGNPSMRRETDWRDIAQIQTNLDDARTELQESFPALSAKYELKEIVWKYRR